VCSCKPYRNVILNLDAFHSSVPSPERALAASRAYATHPHLAGSDEDLEDAKVMLHLFQEEFHISPPSKTPIFSAGTAESRQSTLGLTSRSKTSPSAWIDVYYPVLNTPLDRSLEILGADGEVSWSADLVEDGDPLDPDAAKYKDAVPTFHGLSFDGDVEGQLIYANYGSKEDYDELLASGANLTGKIVIARYGGLFRGLKVGIFHKISCALTSIESHIDPGRRRARCRRHPYIL